MTCARRLYQPEARSIAPSYQSSTFWRAFSKLLPASSTSASSARFTSGLTSVFALMAERMAARLCVPPLAAPRCSGGKAMSHSASAKVREGM